MLTINDRRSRIRLTRPRGTTDLEWSLMGAWLALIALAAAGWPWKLLG